MDWQELANSSFIAIVFAFMLAKLFSLLLSFREGNLRVERQRTTSPSAPLVRQANPSQVEKHNPSSDADVSDVSASDHSDGQMSETGEGAESHSLEGHVAFDKVSASDGNQGGIAEIADAREAELGDAESCLTSEGKAMQGGGIGGETAESCLTSEGKAMQGGGIGGETLLSDSDDWEGVESTELEEIFSDAATYVMGMSLDPSLKVANDIQLQFYGLYKLATEGPCRIPQPPAFRISARAKWHVWQKLGDIPSEEAMQRYIMLLSELRPGWDQHLKKGKKQIGDEPEQSATSSESKGGMRPVFSMHAEQEGVEESGNLEHIHIYAREGDAKGIAGQLEHGCPVDLLDGDGRTALHWAVDRGHLEIVKLLLSKGAQINAKDSEGQTALHYAANCEWEEIAKILLEHGADPSAQDNDGETPHGFFSAAVPEQHLGSGCI